ncbi:DEAD/DEAH box helicase [Citrobacter koseri]|uniref:DEAD/DEAH box helicase n=1 Tax=Citrobacter koseri TaxID=545 RepID=UPI0023AEA867|nr:DEAD/DEAH box helicase [Citrobacter koseri]
MKTATIQQTIDELRQSLTHYIEATYHIGHPSIVKQRRELLNQIGGIYQAPYLESTPRYKSASPYNEIDSLPPAALEALRVLSDTKSGKPVIYPSPYTHQLEALQEILNNNRNLMIMTGTGSGKTESFLLPILGKFAIEACENPERFKKYNAVRALVLYPMNALVNDQLSRLRTMFGSPQTVALFEKWAKRPVLFARYTSRTPYAGLRTPNKDSKRLASIGEFFGEIEDAKRRYEHSPSDGEEYRAAKLFDTLKVRGKWPSKESVSDWLGKAPVPWAKRAICRPHDSELITRHEVHASPPDLLITNYSMLEYMMMRPIERGIFDATKEWLDACPDEKFLIVLDEAHLYRGAQGAEVGLLIRRLRERLGIPAERFQVICSTASFSDEGKKNAGVFGAQLSGVSAESFVSIVGELQLRSPEDRGSMVDINTLAAVNLKQFYSADHSQQLAAIENFLKFRGVSVKDVSDVDAKLYLALYDYAPFNRLVNETMTAAVSLSKLPEIIFDDTIPSNLLEKATTVLLAFGSRAKKTPNEASLLPCRIHSFFRGLPGLWICMDPNCPDALRDRRSPAGRLFSQPHERCSCGAPVLEYYTCRHCGTSYARAYTNDVAQPRYLWSKEGERIETASGLIEALHPLDLLIEEPPSDDKAKAAYYDLVSGQLNPDVLGEKYRTVFLAPAKPVTDGSKDTTRGAGPGQFAPCACCNQMAGHGQSSVQDHQTKGDQPFQALLGSQLRIQPPGPQQQTSFAPLRGRKVLIFSDSRQVAARLAGTLQNYSLRDAVRALLPLGYKILSRDPDFSKTLVLNHAYLSVLVAAHKLGVRLRPQLGDAETLSEVEGPSPGPSPAGIQLFQLLSSLSRCPQRLMQAISDTFKHTNMGLDLEALAIATIGEPPQISSKIVKLPDLPGVAETEEAKLTVCRAWLRCWTLDPGIWFSDMPDSWWNERVRSHQGVFTAMNRVLVSKQSKSIFKKNWLPTLLTIFTEQTMGGGHRLVASKLSLHLNGQWQRCNSCKSVHRPVGTLSRCIDCESSDVSNFDPALDEVYKARRGFYRDPIASALDVEDPQLMTIIAAEHTAQLGAAQPDEAFSHSERHEIRFQDIDVAWRDKDRPGEPAIDVLSSTTTMEVGIDIGDLSGVALRNMPPTRANYQQRAGRAGRRANAVATVVAFGSSDSHDDHYFTDPEEMIRGNVIDPRLTLENPEITRRHLRAYLLQRYHEDRIPGLIPGADPNLFSVLGKVGDFKTRGPLLNRYDFAKWLEDNAQDLANAADRWLPTELSPDDRHRLIAEMMVDATDTIDEAIDFIQSENQDVNAALEKSKDDSGDQTENEIMTESEDNVHIVDPATDKLLDRLLYRGVVPRYAFPTDVVAFHVFNQERSTPFTSVIDYAPAQGLALALSQYAPNKQLWINGKQYTSKAIYSPYPAERRDAWGKRKLYFECSTCSHARTDDYLKERENTTETCPACNTPNSFGPARVWFRPVGFAHPIDTPPETEPDSPNETARATRAKLVMQTPNPDKSWIQVSERVRAFKAREFLLVSNTGVDKDGYDYCLACGRIESSAAPEELLSQPHATPFRSEEGSICPGGAAKRHVILGTDFKTDIALFSFPLTEPFQLLPGSIEADSVLRTLCEAMAKAACQTLDIEPGEVLAEYRPALTEKGASGNEVEIFLYDTLAGGAGFSTELVNRARELFEHTRNLLASCPENCDTSCYRCLQSFRNRMDHSLLDRKLGIQFIEHAFDGGYPPYPAERTRRSLDLLARDLIRQYGTEFSFSREVQRYDNEAGAIVIPIVATRLATGAETWISLSSPLAPAIPTDHKLQKLSPQGSEKVECADDLIIRRHLPEASLQLRGKLR